ncbi:p21-C-terminal region-binding protein-domain-containing protein [Limtongia smithiae]|uniref:p21-C-terminal region-binding protein-domain-containing protein n=1 Tax=Limtongia smithiae TaxID=1125753 RepID=UPI0034CF2674
MAKRKGDRAADASADGDSSGEESVDIVNVDFDYYDLRPDIDFHALRNLLRQTFDADNTFFDLSALSDLLLSQSTAPGSTIKTDGPESDPFAFLTVLDAHAAEGSPLGQVVDYMLRKTASKTDFNARLRELLAPASKSSIAVLFSERLINMPTEVIPPMYNMLRDEMANAGGPAENFLLISKSFTETASTVDSDSDSDSKHARKKQKKKMKSKKSSQNDEIFYFHAEDEILTRHADFSTTYKFTNEAQNADSRRTFQDYGIMPQGLVMLLTKAGLSAATDEMLAAFALPPQDGS